MQGDVQAFALKPTLQVHGTSSVSPNISIQHHGGQTGGSLSLLGTGRGRYSSPRHLLQSLSSPRLAVHDQLSLAVGVAAPLKCSGSRVRNHSLPDGLRPLSRRSRCLQTQLHGDDEPGAIYLSSTHNCDLTLMETKQGHFSETPGGAAAFPSTTQGLKNSEFTLNTSQY